MDAVNVIVTALGTALATGGQATLNDTAKEVFEHLKKRIVQAFSGRQKALMILDEYEHDPGTWEKPLKNEREHVTVGEAEYLYNTHSFLLGTNDGKGISVTIRSQPIARNPDLPKFGFIDPRVEETIRKIRRLVRSIKQQGA